TQGVTEIVLAANKALAGQLFLEAGQVVELPEISATATKETVQLWS
ncbi:tail protein X, partial [Klebsiella grimontii]